MASVFGPVGGIDARAQLGLVLADILDGDGDVDLQTGDADPCAPRVQGVTEPTAVTPVPGPPVHLVTDADNPYRLLPSSNFSRVLRGLEKKGLVRRDIDPHDSRSVRLYPTARARENLQHLREEWSQTLGGSSTTPK